MILKVQPAASLNGKVRLAASKSYSIRAFFIAACGGKSVIFYPSDCDDAKVALAVAKTLGAQVHSFRGEKFSISANPKLLKSTRINVRESGTVLRFLLPLLSLRSKNAVVFGEGTLIGRPNLHLLTALRSAGVHISGAGSGESVPISFKGGSLRAGKINIDGSLSSQFISSLLITTPQLKADSKIFLSGKKLVSSDYIAMTILILKEAGIKIGKISDRQYDIKGSQKFLGLKDFYVPSDYGLAAFLMAAATLVSSDIVLQGSFNDRFIQADGRILGFLKKMGVVLTRSKDAIAIKGPFVLKGGTFCLQHCPDLVPIMAVLGLFATGGVRLTKIAHARAKESDRISDLRQELLKVGARVEEREDELRVFPLTRRKANVVLDPHHDHRLAMAFAVLGLKIGVTVRDIQCVQKSYPQFVADMKKLHAPVEVLQ